MTADAARLLEASLIRGGATAAVSRGPTRRRRRHGPTSNSAPVTFAAKSPPGTRVAPAECDCGKQL